ncbi:putative periplasmic protein [Burkholderiales bacterium JOSHI_001]|nr:putative periplasmic protein [Burkholderiales bacterium JOSHI_001]
MIAEARRLALKFAWSNPDNARVAPQLRGLPTCVQNMPPQPVFPTLPTGVMASGLRRGGLGLHLVLWSLVAALLLLRADGGRAWDANRMLQAAQAAGPRALNAVRVLQQVLQSVNGTDDEAQLAAVNQFFNRQVIFTDDMLVWGVVDHWASPIETLAKGRGDCEDYAIAKYFSLLALGMPTAKLRLVYVRVQTGGAAQAHMVLAYYPSPQAEPMVLDNLITDIRPASRRPDLTPVFSFNSDGLWQGTAGASAGDPTVRLSRWREVLAKVREEGFL